MLREGTELARTQTEVEEGCKEEQMSEKAKLLKIEEERERERVEEDQLMAMQRERSVERVAVGGRR